jgi:Protein of unknown function (DUF1203)
MQNVRIVGLRQPALNVLWSTRHDHAGNAVESFTDEAGGWPLRCCLRDSRPGEELAVVAWSPFSWRGPYAEIGPVVLHFSPCDGPDREDEVPSQFRPRQQILRPYDHAQTIAYTHTRLVESGDDLEKAITELLAIGDIAFVQARNVLAGCYSFTAERK